MPEIEHKFFMNRCFQLAKKAEGFTNPNPLVGAVIVKNNKIISQGYHKRAGEKHAEVEAIEKARGNLKRAVLYVNLEPCSTSGRTPPCTREIINSGIKKVVVAVRDPNPLHNGRGIEILRRAGIEVVEGVLEEEAKFLNRVFFKHIQKKIPYVSIKSAISLDARIADNWGNSKWISPEDVRFYLHKELRAKVDAILVGINTVVKDDPLLSARKKDGSLYKKQPKKIVLDTRFRIPEDRKLLKEKNAEVILIIGKSVKKFAKQKKLEKLGVRIIRTKTKNGKILLRPLLNKLYALGICHILVEGGAKTVSSFLEEKLADEIYLSISTSILGGKNLFYQGKPLKLNKAIKVSNLTLKTFCDCLLLRGELKYV